MQFGITLKPDISVERIVGLTKQAENAGFEYGWIFDSHVLWKEPFPLLTLMAQNTERMRLGTCVTNPATRDPSVTASVLAVLQIISKGRMDLGYGPKALEVTGRVADGAIIQLADPSLVGWCVGLAREGATKAGRDPGQLRI